MQESSTLFNAFEGKSCLTVPVYNRNQMLGRLYVVEGKSSFDYAEIDFVLQVMKQVIPVWKYQNWLIDLRLKLQTRRGNWTGHHDSVIQPYIGLQFGLAAVKQKLTSGNTDVMNEIKDLLELTEGEIQELRNYVGGLKRGESSQSAFLPAVRHFAAKFSDATGLTVEINSAENLQVYDRLAAELFQMIEEGLSNIRRHSRSNYAKVGISRKNGDLILQVRNQRGRGLEESSFAPRSIVERATALGGKTVVFTENNETVVSVQIPL